MAAIVWLTLQENRIGRMVSRFADRLPKTKSLRRAVYLRRVRVALAATWRQSLNDAQLTLASQAGFSMLGVLGGAALVIVGLALFMTRGMPQIYTIASNTTAMSTAGMSSDAIQWSVWGFWGVTLVVIAGVVTLVVKKYGHADGGGGGGGGGGGRRRRR